MDCDRATSSHTLYDKQGSNPFPFLLWIATFGEVPHDVGIHSVVTLFHFYCGLRQQRIKLEGEALAAFVVTLFHFYCGLRLSLFRLAGTCIVRVVTLFHFYCGLRQLQCSLLAQSQF